MIKILSVCLAICSVSVAARPTILQGDFTPGGTIIGRVEQTSQKGTEIAAGKKAQVYVDGKEVRVATGGEFIFGLGRNAKGVVEVKVVTSDTVQHTASYSIGTRDYNIQKIEGVKKKHVTPPKEVLQRIAKEGREVKAARAFNVPRTDFLQPFIWPLAGPITGVYGSQRYYNGKPRSPHYGLDIAAPKGTAVVAPASGIVRLASNDLYYSGGTLILDHGHGFSSTFIHLHKVLVQVGDVVAQGAAIAEVGATGRATGPHLDWRLNWFSVRMDPALFMKNTPMPNYKQAPGKP